MFVAPGSLFQIVVANLVSLGFAFASAWYQPYEVCRCIFNHLWPSETTTVAVLNCSTAVCCHLRCHWQHQNGAANIFKVGTEIALLATLSFAVMLRIDLSGEDVWHRARAPSS